MAQVPELPRDLPLVERHAVRIVVRDGEGRVLLFHTRDVGRPEEGTWWELPGGGLDPGETHVEAAVRELREETGIVIDPADVGPPLWRRTATFRFRDRRRLQHEVVVEVRLPGAAPDLSAADQTAEELEDYVGHRWWSPAEIVASPLRFYPGRLPSILTAFLAGEVVDEPFEFWS